MSVYPLGGILHQSFLRFLYKSVKLLYPGLGFGSREQIKYFDCSCVVLI